jgi:hypothetical protein
MGLFKHNKNNNKPVFHQVLDLIIFTGSLAQLFSTAVVRAYPYWRKCSA